ncbi:Protein of uncharacterised function (DUF1214) [Cedecea lapagei]|uniref:Protein of uncharacterized function (DUF1214) n=1 Tax=Cedecea lapagei TaxID=158823 RepID=A0A447V3U6_9ENTR|nr:DUF1214 domain-containing protein [Cedecea lapagei]VEB98567.1 Protein of uncharacterised function (DUF1214) [Cedecea lapagei]
MLTRWIPQTNEKLDKLAFDIYNQAIDETTPLYQKFAPAKQKAKNAYLAAHAHYLEQLKDEVAKTLDSAINELLFSAIQKSVNSDPLSPYIYWVNNAKPRPAFDGTYEIPGGRYSYDNPDAIYRMIPIDGSQRYILRGQQNTAGGTGDYTYSLIFNPNSQNTVAYLDKSTLKVEVDGSYIITIDNTPGSLDENHLQSTDKVSFLFIRHNITDWSVETADTLSVELAGQQRKISQSLSDIIDTAIKNLDESSITYGVGAMGLETYIPNLVNTLPQPKQSPIIGTLVTQASSFGHIDINESEAFIITITPGKAGYFIVPVTNAWIISVDAANHQSSLNNTQAHSNNDGTYTFVVSIQDPGVANWIDTVGLHENTLMIRWQDMPENAEPALNYELVTFSELSQHLPPETQYVTPDERAKILEQRSTGYNNRLVN